MNASGSGMRDRGYWFVLAAFLAAVIAVSVLAFVPLGTAVEEFTEVTIPESTWESEHQQQVKQHQEVVQRTIPEVDGWGAVLRVAVPLFLLSGMPLLVPRGRSARLVRGISTVLLTAGMLAAMSVSIFILPVALLMFVATILSAPER